MREILFRGKRKDNGELIEGYLLKVKTLSPSSNKWVEKTLILIQQDDVCEVIPETVGQYTGLTDTNGAEIFEADIVSCQMWVGDEYSDGRQNWHVSFKDGSFVIDKNCYVPKKLSHNNIQSYDIKVIGNIYDNPELLEEK